MKQDMYWSNDETRVWDVTDPTAIISLSDLRIDVLRVGVMENHVLLRGPLPRAGEYLNSWLEGHTLQITWDCSKSEDYHSRPVVAELPVVKVLERWVDSLVNSTHPGVAAVIWMYVRYSCDVEFFFDGEGKHVR